MAQLAQTSEQIKVKIQTNTNAKGLSKNSRFPLF